MSAAVKKKLLIVDDNESLLLALEHNLRQAGYSVVKAYDGKEALSRAREQMPDLIVSDVGMPEMDGIEFCKKLRDIDEFSEIPFVFLTAHGETDEKILGLRSGADDYIVKPFDMNELVARVDVLYEKKHTRRRSQKLSGRLAEISVSDVLQFLDLAQKEGTLHISGDGKKGEISVRGGLLAGGSYDAELGEDALVELLQLPDGFFHFEPKKVLPVGAEQPIGFAVMEAMRLIDERAALASLLPEASRRLSLVRSPGDSDLDIEAVCAALSEEPFSLAELRLTLSFSQTRLAVAVGKLMKQGCLEVLDGDGDPAAAAADPDSPADSPDEAPPPEPEPSIASEPTPEPPAAERQEVEPTAVATVLAPTPQPPPRTPDPQATSPARPSEAKAPTVRPRKVLLAFTDKEDALRVLRRIAEAFRAEPPRGFRKGSVEFQRIQLPSAILHLFSAPGERRLSFLWEPLLATSDAAMFLVDTSRGPEDLAFFRKALDGGRGIPFVVVSNGDALPDQENARAIRTPADAMSVMDDLLKPLEGKVAAR